MYAATYIKDYSRKFEEIWVLQQLELICKIKICSVTIKCMGLFLLFCKQNMLSQDLPQPSVFLPESNDTSDKKMF